MQMLKLTESKNSKTLKKGFPNVWHHAKPVWYVEELYLINKWSQLESNVTKNYEFY